MSFVNKQHQKDYFSSKPNFYSCVVNYNNITFIKMIDALLSNGLNYNLQRM